MAKDALKWSRMSKSTWLREDGKFIARFNWGMGGVCFLLYGSRNEYEKQDGDYKYFKALKLAKCAA